MQPAPPSAFNIVVLHIGPLIGLDSHSATPLWDLPESHDLAALRMQVITSPSMRGGLCWMTLFSDWPTELNQDLWIPVNRIKTLAAFTLLREDLKFSLWFRHPGLIHLEVDINGTWTVQDVLSLPGWMLVGGTFKEDGEREGYSATFLEDYCIYASDRRQSKGRRASSHSTGSSSSGSSSGSMHSSSLSSTGSVHDKKFLVDILENNSDPEMVIYALRNHFQRNSNAGLTRFDMELIARATGQFCYSACVSSPENFIDDLVKWEMQGNTMDTYHRFISNKADKDRDDLREKSLHMDLYHISRYPFDGAVEVSTLEIMTMVSSMLDLKDKITAGDADGCAVVIERVVSQTQSSGDGKFMALVYELSHNMDIDLDIFGGRIWRIISLDYFNSAEEAAEDDAAIQAEEAAIAAAATAAAEAAVDTYL